MKNGYLRLSREIEEWGWYKDSNTFRVFFHLLLKANWKDGMFMGIPILRGQVVTGRKRLASELNISEQSVRTSIKRLKSTSEITIKTTSKFSIVTICNFDSWVFLENQSNQQINQQPNQQLTSKQPATNQQLTTSNNVITEERNNINNIYFDESVDSSCDSSPLPQPEIDIEETKREKKKVEKIHYPSEFEDDFALYQRKGSKKKAYERWKKLSDEDKEKMRKHIRYYLESNERPFLKDFEGYINQRMFESPVYDRRGEMTYDPDRDAKRDYVPSGRGFYFDNDSGLFMLVEPFYDKVFDNYYDEERPDGARLKLNNARGIIRWNKKLNKWEFEK